jgi:peptide deformylase
LQHEIDHLKGQLYIDRAQNVREAVTEEEEDAPQGAAPERAEAY